ncbi:hypothetical protein [Candidatus Uabimicrobium amorphum]|uniref:Tetratricopeptide repeat protein n=1 Tax=Uabimicrobium amorphum TaxID=2596890 RepID=A0A5S9F206_UABAM|nr:hypothetical protein [Candidatus Uabimicrobium amorphum]BBM83167.1 hypothetical protein UABAM_01518 [Candidatus Uabimicrobium amorphum]
MYKLISITILGCLLCSCTLSVVRVRTAVDVPAEINLIPYKKIKVTSESGKYAPHIKEQLSIRMGEAFEIVDSGHDAEIRINCKERFDGEDIEEKSVTRTTRINEMRTDETQPFKNEFMDADYEKTKRYIRTTVVELDVKFEVFVDEELFATKKYTPYNEMKKERVGSPPPLMEEEKVLHGMLFYIVREFAKSTVPQKSYGEVRLQKVRHGDFYTGVEFAQQGNWQEAMNIFHEIYLEENPDSEVHARNIYNYAVSLQYTANTVPDPVDRLKDASKMYEKAYETYKEYLYKSQLQDCEDEISRIKRLRRNEVKKK